MYKKYLYAYVCMMYVLCILSLICITVHVCMNKSYTTLTLVILFFLVLAFTATIVIKHLRQLIVGMFMFTDSYS